MDTRQVIARFEAERQALALMDHPNIATRARCRARPQPAGRTSSWSWSRGCRSPSTATSTSSRPAQRLELFVPVCQAVQHAHQKGIIHRDLKPSNVLVALYDGKPVPKVIDFGVAKATGQQLTEQDPVHRLRRRWSARWSTCRPSRRRSIGLDIDTRSDIYSLGVLLYELLTGTTPLHQEASLKKAGYAGDAAA